MSSVCSRSGLTFLNLTDDFRAVPPEQAARLHGEICVAMRVYFEKPRTTTGWKGLINDPHLDGSGDVNTGLRMARGLLLEVLELVVPRALFTTNTSTSALFRAIDSGELPTVLLDECDTIFNPYGTVGLAPWGPADALAT